MAIRNTNLGGATNWASEGVSSSDLNDTFDAVIRHTITFGRATQVTTSAGTAWQIVTSGVINAASGSVVTDMSVNAAMSNNASARTAYALVLLTGANLGQKCYDSISSYWDYGTGYTRSSCMIGFPSSSAITMRIKSTADLTASQLCNYPIQLLDAATTVSVYLAEDAAGGTSSMQNLTCSVSYVQKGKVN